MESKLKNAKQRKRSKLSRKKNSKINDEKLKLNALHRKVQSIASGKSIKMSSHLKFKKRKKQHMKKNAMSEYKAHTVRMSHRSNIKRATGGASGVASSGGRSRSRNRSRNRSTASGLSHNATLKRKRVTHTRHKKVKRLRAGHMGTASSLQLSQESPEHFTKTFSAACRVIEQHIECARKRQKTSGANSTTQEALTLCTDIAQEIQDLHNYLQVSLHFLKDNDVKQHQNMLSELTRCCRAARLHVGYPLQNFITEGIASLTQKNPPHNNGASMEQLKMVMPQLARPPKSVSFNWTISNRSSEHIILQGSQVHRRHLTIANLYECFVEIRGHPVTVQISHARHCVFLVGPTSRALLGWHCDNCIICVACQQIRLHSSKLTRVYLCGRATIEDCRQIEFGEYNYQYAGIEDDFHSAELKPQKRNTLKVVDLSCQSPYMRSPNWRPVEGTAKTPNWSQLRYRYE